MLTEIGHGLDARNLQTTATILPDGNIDLHTPSPGDAKYVSNNGFFCFCSCFFFTILLSDQG